MPNGAGMWLVVLAGAAAAAAQFDMAAIQKWTGAKIVHYEVTGTFRGTTPIAAGSLSSYGEMEVSDKVTLSLDWDVRGNAVVGQAKFANTATQLVKTGPGAANCPPPTVKGPYEHLDVTSLEPHSSGLSLKGTRSFPAASIPSQWPASCAPQPTPAHTDAVSELVVIPSPMLLVMPSGANPNLTIASDRKSFTLKQGAWLWTFTPTIVK